MLFVFNAAPARAATGPYGGQATGDLVHVNAADFPGVLDPGLADAHIAPSAALVKSDGLAAPYAGKRSAARAANLDSSLIGGAIPLNNLIVKAEQSAPPTNANPDVQSLTGPIDLSPIAQLEAAKASAHAVWGSSDTACIAPGSPIATSTSTVLDASLLGLGAPLGDSLVSVVNGNGGAAFTKSDVGLVNVANQANKGLNSTVLDQVTGVVLFKGTANEITLNVVAPPTVSATATGTAATSTVSYNEPVVQVIQGGSVTDVLNASNINTEITIPGVVLDLSLGQLKNVVKTNNEASGTASLLELKVLDITKTLTLADVAIAPMAVKATVPTGGVECNGGTDPLANLQVDASTGIVLPNGSFQYVVTVPNTGACTLDNVHVTLTVAGPNGTTITAAEPSPNTINGLNVDWPNIGSIAPGALKTLKATIKVPSNAPVGATYTGTAHATGTCAGAPAEHTATSGPIPTVGSPSATSCDLSASSIVSSHKEVRIGDYFNEYVRLTNLGKGTCNTVKVTMPYPPDTTFVACTDSCTHDDTKRVVTWTVSSLGSGVSKDLVGTFQVANSAKSGEHLGTKVTITSGGRTVTDSTTLPVVTSSNVLNAGAQRSRGLLPRTGANLPLGLALSLLGAGLAMRAFRRKVAAV
ncbi:MAG TPA: hypothetical protein VHC63_00355 [Acidimicrobiales bacterium]|nr:hypothetical protein [Acidimicrobiales bacterium]